MRSLVFSFACLFAAAGCEVGNLRPIGLDAAAAIVLPADHPPIPGSPTLFVAKAPPDPTFDQAGCAGCHNPSNPRSP